MCRLLLFFAAAPPRTAPSMLVALLWQIAGIAALSLLYIVVRSRGDWENYKQKWGVEEEKGNSKSDSGASLRSGRFLPL